MAKNKVNQKRISQKPKKEIPPKKLKAPRQWLENKIALARKLSEHQAARATSRLGAPAGVALLAFLILYSLLSPKDKFQLEKEQLIKEPRDLQAHLVLAQEYLDHNQIEGAEKELLLVQKNLQFPISSFQSEGKVLGEETNQKLEELWQRKQAAKPEDIRQMITSWEKIIAAKPNYRDGYLQLALLHYKLFENEKAKEYLQQALELDPNFGPARELEKIIQ
jgi:tetratricopeptide (TPR) repeat protein